MSMGLSISRSLIQAHEGTLYFDSKPGKEAAVYQYKAICYIYPAATTLLMLF
jgi:signal transduction histidine kinase